MLAYKAWLESRARFAVSAVALGWLSTVYVVWQPGRADAQPPLSYHTYIAHAIYGSVLLQLFAGSVLVLGLGGLLQEKARGTAGFTLALPLRRARHVAARAAVGLIETGVLALLAGGVVCGGAPLVGESYPAASALHFFALWAGAGSVLFAGALLVSTIVAGEYSAPVVCFAALFLYLAIVNLPPLDRFPLLNPFAVMSLSGPVPWLALWGMMLAALGLMAIGRAATERQEF